MSTNEVTEDDLKEWFGNSGMVPTMVVNLMRRQIDHGDDVREEIQAIAKQRHLWGLDDTCRKCNITKLQARQTGKFRICEAGVL